YKFSFYSRHGFLSVLLPLQVQLCPFQVRGSIDFDRFLVDERDMDSITVLQQAQLFQTLDLLQRRGPEPRKLKQKIATVDIKSEMTITPKPPLDARAYGFARGIDACISHVRNRRPGKIN